MLELHYARRSERRGVDIGCELVARSWDQPLPHRMTNVSAFGAWLQTSLPLEVGERVVVSFRPPRWRDRREITVFAEVTRNIKVRERNGVRRNGMGLEFIDMTAGERREMQYCLRAMPPARNRRHDVLRLPRERFK